MEDNDHEDMQILSKVDALQGKSAALTLESSTNIVAYGTFICVDPQKLLHGVTLPFNCYRVSVDVVAEKSVPLPFPIANECVVGDALGTHVAWPQHLIVEQDKKPRKKDLAPPKEKHVVSPAVPISLHMMYCYSKHALGEERFISLRLDREVFDDDCVIFLHYEDIDGLYQVGPISGNCVIAYIWYLYKKMLGDKKEGKFRFVNPHRIRIWEKLHTTKRKSGSFLKQQLNTEFEMKDLGEAKRILGMDIVRNRKRQDIHLSHKNYLKKVVLRYNINQAKSVLTPLG